MQNNLSAVLVFISYIIKPLRSLGCEQQPSWESLCTSKSSFDLFSTFTEFEQNSSKEQHKRNQWNDTMGQFSPLLQIFGQYSSIFLNTFPIFPF